MVRLRHQVHPADLEELATGVGVVDPQSVHPNPEVAAAVTANQPSGPQPFYVAASLMEFHRPHLKVVEDEFEDVCAPDVLSTTAPTTITTTTITNTTIDLTVAEVVAAAEEAGAAGRAVAAAEGAARRQQLRETLSLEVSAEEWAPTAAGLTQHTNDHVDATLERWREPGQKSPFLRMGNEIRTEPTTEAPTPTTEVGRGATARLATCVTPRFGAGAPAPVYSNLETPVMAPGSGAVPRRPLWPDQGWLEEVSPTIAPSGSNPAKDPCAGTPLGDLVLEVSDLADLSINPRTDLPVGAMREESLWDTVASVIGGPVHYANVERKAAAKTAVVSAETEISPAPSRPNRKVLRLDKKKRAPLQRGRSEGPPPNSE